MAGEVNLTASLRSNLLSLQSTQSLLNQTQNRLATGKKVNSALDNATSFFASQALTDRASDLSRLLDGVGQSIQVIKAADNGINALKNLVDQAKSIAETARDQAIASGGAPADQATLVADYNAIRTQIDQLIQDTGFRGTNLLNGNNLTVQFNEDNTSSLTVTGTTFDSAGLGISVGVFGGEVAIQANLDELTTALGTIRDQARTFGTNLSIIQNREDFTKGLVNTLTEGSDKLVLADLNEEGAKLLSLQTAQSLGVTSLSLASQAQQSVLRLF